MVLVSQSYIAFPRPERPTVLVCLGGYDFEHLLDALLRCEDSFDFPTDVDVRHLAVFDVVLVEGG